jgi:mycofactocin system creatininase family protein
MRVRWLDSRRWVRRTSDVGETSPTAPSVWLADLTWPEVGQRVRAGAVLAVPLGSTEQHGPHLPLSTDTDIAVALCERLAAAREDVLIAPAVAYGSSGEHAGFPGTLSIGQVACEMLVVELGRSAADTFAHLLFVSAHGGNAEPVTRAVDRLRAESRDVCLFMPRWKGDPHAGLPETSMLLAMSPERVHLPRAVAGDTRPLGEIWPLLRDGGVRAVSDSGILGDPTGATADEGTALLNELAAALIEEVATWRSSTRSLAQI